jgi:hypothetical protein
MADHREALRRKLAEQRARHEARRVTEWLADRLGIVVAGNDVLGIRKAEAVRDAFFGRLGTGVSEHVCVDAHDRDIIRLRLHKLAGELHDLPVLFIRPDELAPIVVRVRASAVLAGDLDQIVNRQHDLALATEDARDGVYVERNHASPEDEFEWSSWGIFSTPEAV